MDEPKFKITFGEFQTRLDDGRLRCDLCPHGCALRDGQRGVCFARIRHGGQIVIAGCGRTSGLCADPIEKKPLFHFLPGTVTLSLGTVGCNLRCHFCQNWRLSRCRDERLLAEEASPSEIAETAKRLGCQSVAFTYNEPVVFMEYAIAVAEACRKRGLKTVAVTAGYVLPAPAELFFRHLDAVNVDLKAFSERFYRDLCGGRLQPVLDTLLLIKKKTAAWLELTTLLIPGENDSPEELNQLTRWVVSHLGPDVPLHFSAFHPAGEMLDKRPTSPETLSVARHLALANGVRHAYVGNVRDPDGEATFCRGCGKKIIARVGFTIRQRHLTEAGDCLFCGQRCAGVFSR